MNQTHKTINKNEQRVEEFEQAADLENGQVQSKNIPKYKTGDDMNIESHPQNPQTMSGQAVEAQKTIECSKKRILLIFGIIIVVIALILGLTFGLTFRLGRHQGAQVAQAKLLRANSQSNGRSQGLFDPNKLYEIQSVLAPGKVLDVSMRQKLKLIIFRRHNGQNQRFKIVESCPGKYKIIATFTKDHFSQLPQGGSYSLQVPNNSKTIGERIVANYINNQPNQLWEIVLTSDGVYTIKAFNDLALDVYGGFTNDETPITQYPGHGGKNQQWIIRLKQNCKCGQGLQFGLLNPNQQYQFESVLKPGMLLIASLNPKQILKMILFQKSMTSNERFNIIQAIPGKYQIITTIQGKKYSLSAPSSAVSQRLQVNQVKSQPQQYWEFVPVSNGIYKLKSIYGLIVDVCHGQTINETPIIQHPSHGGKNQQWIIKLIC